MRLAALRNRDFALFWSGHVVSRMGTQMRDVALAWHVYLLTKSPVALGLLGAFRVAPLLLLGLFGGVAADALDRRRVMLATQSILALTSVGLALATRAEVMSLPLLYTLVALSSAATAFDNPARQALLTNLLPPADLPNGLALGILGWQLATVVGPAVGGVLIAEASLEAIYWVDAGSFAAVLGALAIVRPSRDDAPGERPRIELSAIADALRFLKTRPALVQLMVIDFLATFFGGAMLLMPIFANEVFHVGPRGLGMLVSAPAVGALVTGAFLALRRPITHWGPVVLGSVACYGASIAAFGVTPWYPLALVLLAISGAADTVSTVVRQIARQMMTPDAMRGRMTSITMMFFVSGPQLGEVEAGLVAAATSARVSFATGGAACVLVALVFLIASPSLRRLEAASGEQVT